MPRRRKRKYEWERPGIQYSLIDIGAIEIQYNEPRSDEEEDSEEEKEEEVHIRD